MKVSVIIPTFNAEKYILPLLESIEQQTRLPDEVIISDDGSGDQTTRLIEEHVHQSSISFTVLDHSPDGISANYENALFRSTGDIVIVGDHDDVWLPNKVAVIREAFSEQADVSLVAFDSEVVDSNLNSLGTTLRGGKEASRKQAKLAARDDFRFFLMGARLDAHTLAFTSNVREVMLRADFRKAPGFWFENRVCAAALSIGRLLFLPDTLTLYRQHSGQHSGLQKQTLTTRVHRDVDIQFTRLGALRELLKQNESQSLLTAAEVRRRLELLEQYIQFLESREIEDGVVSKVVGSAKSFAQGDYFRFSRNPVLSFAKDLLRSVRAKRSTS